MLYLLDTNVLSELRKVKSGRCAQQVIDWAESVSISDTFISAISVLEIERGILLKEKSDSRQGKILRQWFEEYVLSEYQGRVLAVDRQVARHCARLHVPDKRSLNDSLIAATAFINGMTVVTRNIADFTHMDIPLLNPWAEV